MNKRMKPAAALKLVRAAARKRDLTVEELPGRGKGSHAMYRVVDPTGREVGRFAVTGHGGKDISIGVLRSVEDALAHLFGPKWLEK